MPYIGFKASKVKLDDLLPPDDNTDLNASTLAHGLLRKLSGNITDFLRGDGTWANPTTGFVSGGSNTQSGNGTTMVFTIAHGRTGTPTKPIVAAGSADAVGPFSVTIDATNITITYPIAPPAGSSNLVWRWLVLD